MFENIDLKDGLEKIVELFGVRLPERVDQLNDEDFNVVLEEKGGLLIARLNYFGFVGRVLRCGNKNRCAVQRVEGPNLRYLVGKREGLLINEGNRTKEEAEKTKLILKKGLFYGCKDFTDKIRKAVDLCYRGSLHPQSLIWLVDRLARGNGFFSLEEEGTELKPASRVEITLEEKGRYELEICVSYNADSPFYKVEYSLNAGTDGEQKKGFFWPWCFIKQQSDGC